MRIALFTETYLPHINGVVTHVKILRDGAFAAGTRSSWSSPRITRPAIIISRTEFFTAPPSKANAFTDMV